MKGEHTSICGNFHRAPRQRGPGHRKDPAGTHGEWNARRRAKGLRVQSINPARLDVRHPWITITR
jgi:hypothetical protein